jgi:imidazolonepropionase
MGMLIHSASQLLTLAGGPQRGQALGNLGILSDGAVLIQDGRIVETGETSLMLAKYPHEARLDAGGRVVMPGFVDPHTHLVWAGDRAGEFELKLQGKSFLEILAAGMGILSTVRQTRSAGVDELAAQTRPRALSLLRHGTTTAEVKSGYGLDTPSELNQLQAILKLDDEGPLEMIPPFMGAHAVPPEYRDDPDGYTQLVCGEMLPAVRTWWQRNAAGRPLPFVDVFCETGAFDLQQTRRILETAKQAGFPLKVHADEFDNLGGATLAVDLGAVSADHLVKTSPADIAALGGSDTAAVALPCTPFGLAEPHYTPARAILEAGGILAVASDINPGAAWGESMQFVIALACRYMRLTPAQAIVAATINAAAAAGAAGRLGSLEPGKQADVLILNVSDYRHLGYRFAANLVDTVIKRGRVVVRGQVLV